MPEAEVRPTGEIVVEGKQIGRIEGFRFFWDLVGDENEASSLRSMAESSVTTELEMRSARFSISRDDQLHLSLDGIIRYIGEPVAILQAGDRVLEPRFLLLCDERLVDIHKEMVETRLYNWVKAYIQKLLGSLLALEVAEGLSERPKKIASKLAENLGILDKLLVIQDLRQLDQPARAELRKLGVRFGAYYIFIPLLMKPGPRGLATQLFALFRGLDATPLQELSLLAFSGRTSFHTENVDDKELYCVAGFRIVGTRAIRVDILERLADIIRPAISYRPGISDGTPPAGTADGNGFVVTSAMTSLVGCSGTEFGEILKSLGYRVETRKGPAITIELKSENKHKKDNSEVDIVADNDETLQESEHIDVEGSDEEVQVVVEAFEQQEVAISSTNDIKYDSELKINEDESTENTITLDASDVVSADVDSEVEKDAIVEVWFAERSNYAKREEKTHNRKSEKRVENKDFRDRKKEYLKNDDSVKVDASEKNKGGYFKKTAKEQVSISNSPKSNNSSNPASERNYRKLDKKDDRKSNKNPSSVNSFSSSSKPKFNKQPDPDSPFAKLAALKEKLEKGG